MSTTPLSALPTMPAHLFAMSYLATHSRGLPKVGKLLSPDASPSCHFCVHSAPPIIPHYEITKRWYPRTFSDWNRIIDLSSNAICAACAYALKYGLKGWILTSTQARHLKPSSPEWASLLITPPEPPFALILNCVHLKKGRLTADGAKPRHLLLSAKVAWNREHFPVAYGVHETTWIRASDARALMDGWRTIIQLGASDGLWTPAQIPKFLTALSIRWLTDHPAPTSWPEPLRIQYQALPHPLRSSRLVLEFAIRRALIAEFAAHPPITNTVTPHKRKTNKGASR